MEALQKLSASIGLLILRLGAGGLMATHGWGKMKMLMDGQSAQFGSHLGMSPGMSLFLAVVGEFFCALLVMAGLATRLAAIPTVITMFVAAFVAHGGDPWTMEAAAKLFFEGKTKFMLSKEPALMFMIPFLALSFTGPGALSLDAVVWPWWKKRKQKPG